MIELNHKIFGEGDPIIILHGLFGMLDNWQTFAKKLAEDYMVILIDQRNHGKSPHADEFNYTLLAEDLKNFMDSNWIYQAHIIGHSMGGKTAMQFASLYPDAVEKLVVVDIGPNENPSGHDIIFEALNSVPIDKVDSRKEVEKVLQKKISDLSVILFLMKNLQREKSGGYKWKMNLASLEKNYSHILDSIEVSSPIEIDTLFAKGDRSNYINAEVEKEITEKFLSSTIKTIGNSGHWIHAEQPEELYKIITEFVRS
jgi:pimeloyl-ACP methyl ester carboxylesterase